MPARKARHSQDHILITGNHNSARFFFPTGNTNSEGQGLARIAYENCMALLESQHSGHGSRNRLRDVDLRRLTRNWSLVDVHSQLLHESLVEEVNKRRLFNTVGAVENIGFQAPPAVSERRSQHMSRRNWK